MTRRVCFLLFVLAGGSLLSVSAQDADVIFRSDVSLVRVDAQVVDRDNRAITGLRVSDFILLEEGKPQPIRNFASESMPVDVLLLLDVSASMRPHVQRIADAAHQALRVMGQDDRVAIMVFDRSARLRLSFRKSRSDVEREFERLLNQETFHGGTDITRGLLDAANYVSREGRRDARRAIVILTDDQTEFNRDEAGVGRALTRADAVLCALIAPDAMRYQRGGGMPQGGGWPPAGPPNRGPLGGVILGQPRGPYGRRGPIYTTPRTHSAGTSEIARASGGDSMGVDDAYALESTLARIRQRYALHFNLPANVKPGQERNIEVSLSDAARQRYPGADVRYRRVYLAPADAVGGTAPDPTVITQAPVDSGESNRGAPPRRRPAVNEGLGSREGPLDVAGGSPAARSQPRQADPEPQSVWRRAEGGDAKATSNQDKTPEQEPEKGGWRRATPADK